MAIKTKPILEDPTLPPLARAAHIGMLILKGTGCNTWQVLVDSPQNQLRVLLSEEQQQLIDEYSFILQYLQVSPIRSIMYCENCSRFALKDKAISKTTTCSLTVGCGGTLHYVKTTPFRGAAK